MDFALVDFAFVSRLCWPYLDHQALRACAVTCFNVCCMVRVFFESKCLFARLRGSVTQRVANYISLCATTGLTSVRCKMLFCRQPLRNLQIEALRETVVGGRRRILFRKEVRLGTCLRLPFVLLYDFDMEIGPRVPYFGARG